MFRKFDKTSDYSSQTSFFNAIAILTIITFYISCNIFYITRDTNDIILESLELIIINILLFIAYFTVKQYNKLKD